MCDKIGFMKKKTILVLFALIIICGLVGVVLTNQGYKLGWFFSFSPLSGKEFTNSKYKVSMYPPKGWNAVTDEYFNAQIMFFDQPRATISDFSGQNAVITLSVYPIVGIQDFNATDLYINNIKQSNEKSEQLWEELGDETKNDPEHKRQKLLNSKFLKAVENKQVVTVDGIKGITFDFGLYFGGNGAGKTIILEHDNKLFVIISEAFSDEYWAKNKDIILKSMMSLAFTK